MQDAAGGSGPRSTAWGGGGGALLELPRQGTDEPVATCREMEEGGRKVGGGATWVTSQLAHTTQGRLRLPQEDRPCYSPRGHEKAVPTTLSIAVLLTVCI